MEEVKNPLADRSGGTDDVPPDLLARTQVYLEAKRSGHVVNRDCVSAWNDFYLRYLPTIRDQVRRLGVREPEASDCVQEVWKDLIVRLPSFRPDPGRCSFRTWLRVI